MATAATLNVPQQNLIFSQHATLQGKTYYIYRNELGSLVGSFETEEGMQETLPLSGIPQRLLKSDQQETLGKFLTCCYFFPSKDENGVFSRISVRPSLDGGMRPKIPFQPGLSLGSIVNADVIDNLEKFSKEAAQFEKLERDLQTFQENIKMFEGKIKALSRKQPAQSPSEKSEESATPEDSLINLYRKSIALCQERMAETQKKLNDLNPSLLPTFEDFQSSLVAPIDFEKSILAGEPRGFESLTYSSQYIDMRTNIQQVHDSMTQSSSSSAVSVGVSAPFFKASGSYSWSHAAMNRVAQIHNSDSSVKMLLINATVTSRYVKYFKKLEYSREKILELLDFIRHEKSRASASNV